MFGFLNINKPAGMTSRQVINNVTSVVRRVKAGHAGTLDPLATGVLVVGLGPATRLIKFVQRMPKEYVADFRFGFHSDTEDIEGELTELPDARVISETELVGKLAEFTGTVSQLPPKYSALKVNGKRAYNLARQGKSVELEPRNVEIYGLQLESFDYPNWRIRIRCGSGTYVRSLGRDIANALGTAGVMTALERTAIGNFRVDNAIGLPQNNSDVQANLLPPQLGLGGMYRTKVDSDQIQSFSVGGTWSPGDDLAVQVHDEVAAIGPNDELIAVLKKKNPEMFTPRINFSSYWFASE